MRRSVCVGVFLASLLAAPGYGADPLTFFNPLKGFTRAPFSAEMEIYSGGITGKSIGAAYDSATRGDYGARINFGFLKALNFDLNYMYSNQTRSFEAVIPPTGTLPSGYALMHAGNLNMAWGDGEFDIAKMGRSKFYISPGVGFARNGARDMTVITPLGTASSPILAGTALTFNLGAGVKFYPLKHFGLHLDVRDHVSGGGTGNLSPENGACPAIYPPPASCQLGGVARFFGPIPVQNNIVFTLGIIFKVI